jgi:hypothetical protein
MDPSAADRTHLAAKSWASGGRRLMQRGQEEAAKVSFQMALDYERKALSILLAYDLADASLILDCYKFAAIYAFEAGEKEQAILLLEAALLRDPPDVFRRELLGLLRDVSEAL